MAKIIELNAGGAVRIGKFDENNAVHVTADISEFQELWPNGTCVIVYERPDGVIYNLAGTIAGSILTIPLTNTESCEVGTGRIEIRWTDTDVLAKSVTYKIKFIDGIDEPTTTPDPPGQTYLDQIAGYATDIAADRAATESARGEVETLTGEVRDIAQGVEADRGATHGYMERAETAADGAEDSAEEAERQAGIAQNNILNGVSTHNVSPASHDDIREAVQTAENIARGRATAYVFDTLAEMEAWLDSPENVSGLVTGDNLYIRDVGVKDYWWDGEAPQELEAEAPDLTDFYTRAQVDALLPIYLSESAYAALVASGTTEAGRVYYPVPDDQWEGS